MKKVTLNRNGQTTAGNREVSDLKAGRFQVCEHVMLAVRDCDCNRIRGERVEYVVAKIEPCDGYVADSLRISATVFGGKWATLRYVKFIRNGLTSRACRLKGLKAKRREAAKKEEK